MSYLPKVAVFFSFVAIYFFLYNHGGFHRAFEETDPMVERFESRRQKVHETCERAPEKGSIEAILREGTEDEENLRRILRVYVYILWDYDVSICTMGKVGSGTWRYHAMFLNHLTESKFHHPLDDARRRQLFKQPWESVLNYSLSLSKWITVRHPLTRLVSCYQDKYKNGTGRPFNEFLKPALRSNGLLPSQTSENVGIPRSVITFKEFITHVIRSFESGGYVNHHWDTYGRLCSPCFFDYDYITKIETQNEDLDYLFNKFGMTTDPAAAVKLKGDQMEKINRDFDYYKQIPVEMKRKLAEIYKDDMEMFGYQLPEGFL